MGVTTQPIAARAAAAPADLPRRLRRLPRAVLRSILVMLGLRDSLQVLRLRREIARLERHLALVEGPHSVLLQSVAEALDAAEHPDPPLPGLRVSVILAVRDRPGPLCDAIRSVLAQRWRDFELIVVDDGSAQPVAPLVRGEFADPRILLLRQPPTGVSAARNRGLRRASGDLVAYLDSDNLWLPGYLEGMVRGFARRPELQAAYGVLISAEHDAETRVYWEPWDRRRLEAANFIDLNVFMHRRGLFAALGGFDEAMDRLVDWDLILRYTAAQPAGRLPAWGAVYRVVDDRRITDRVPIGTNMARIRAKQARCAVMSHRQPR